LRLRRQGVGSAQALRSASAFVAGSYSVQIWHDGGTGYWAIPDIGPAGLSNFRQLFDASGKPGPDKRG
jgi:anti-sigma factor RsiW